MLSLPLFISRLHHLVNAWAVKFNVVEVEAVRIIQQAEFLQSVTEGELHEGDELLGRPGGVVGEGVDHDSWVVGPDGRVLAGQDVHLLPCPQHKEPSLLLQLRGDLQVVGQVLLGNYQ